MSARVVHPLSSLNEMRRLREAVAARPASFRPDPEAKARVSRNLWGKTSADDSRAFAAREMAEQRERAAERWGFDFLREVPRSHGPGAQRYKWTRVRIGTVPTAYKMPGLLLDRVLETARATVPFVAAAPRDSTTPPQLQQQPRQESAAMLKAPTAPLGMVPSLSSLAASTTSAAAQPQPGQAVTMAMTPIVPIGMVSPDLIGASTTFAAAAAAAAASNTSTSTTTSAAPAASLRQPSVTAAFRIRKRTNSEVKRAENPAKRRRAEEASL